jgi:hypothetical protein
MCSRAKQEDGIGMKNKIAILLAFLIIPATAIAQQTGKYSAAGIDNDAAVERFLHDLQEAVSKNQRAKVTSMIAYPIKVGVGRHREVIRKKSEMLKKYDSVFNQKVKEALGKQKVSELFVNGQGVMVGDGEIWFNQMAGSENIRITAINN